MPSHARYFARPAHSCFNYRFNSIEVLVITPYPWFVSSRNTNHYYIQQVKVVFALGRMAAFAIKPGGLILFALPKKYAKTLGKIMLPPSCHRTPAILPGLRAYGFIHRFNTIEVLVIIPWFVSSYSIKKGTDVPLFLDDQHWLINLSNHWRLTCARTR